MTGPYRILRGNPALARLLVGQGLSSLADWLLAVVMTVLVYTISHSGTTVSLLTFTRLAPYALVLPWSGLALDRADRRLLMTFLGLSRAACMLALLFVGSSTTLPLAFPLVFLSSSLSCMLRPALNATIPDLIGARDAVPANSLVTQLDGAAHIAGPALGAGFVLLGDPHLGLIIATGAFLLSGMAFYLAPFPPGTSAASHVEFNAGEILAGFQYIWRENQHVLVALTATAAGLALLAGAYYVLAIVLCTETFHLGGQGVGWLDAVYGLGGLAGSLIMAGTGHGRRVVHVLVIGAGLNALGVLFLAVSPPGPLPFACMAIVGIAGVAVQVAGTTILQAAAPRDMLGRLFTAFEATLVLAMLGGALGAGPLIKLVGPRGATGAFALAGLLLLLLALPRLRLLEEALGLRVFLRGVPMLAGLSRPLLDDLAGHFETVNAQEGSIIVQQGEIGDRLYIVHSGEVEVAINGRVVRRLGPGRYFGEVALLHDVPRTASVCARIPTVLYSLDKAAFRRLTQRVEHLAPRLARDAESSYVYASSSSLVPH